MRLCATLFVILLSASGMAVSVEEYNALKLKAIDGDYQSFCQLVSTPEYVTGLRRVAEVREQGFSLTLFFIRVYLQPTAAAQSQIAPDFFDKFRRLIKDYEIIEPSQIKHLPYQHQYGILLESLRCLYEEAA